MTDKQPPEIGSREQTPESNERGVVGFVVAVDPTKSEESIDAIADAVTRAMIAAGMKADDP